MTVDEILATGRYTDRRGRGWSAAREGWTNFDLRTRTITFLRREHMRLLIERDMHRDACFGLDHCTSHPAWIVSRGFNEDGALGWEILGPYKNQGRLLDVTHAEAMDAACNLAVTT